MTEEEKTSYICNMLLPEDRESYISNAIAAFPEVNRVGLEKLADKVWGPPCPPAEKTHIPSDTDFPDPMFDIAGVEKSQDDKGNIQKNNSGELLTSKELEDFLTNELTIIDQELKTQKMHLSTNRINEVIKQNQEQKDGDA